MTKAFIAIVTIMVGCSARSVERGSAELEAFSVEAWLDPSSEYHPIVNWFWPGGSVTEEELRRELQLFAVTGFGGVEISTFPWGLPSRESGSDPEIYTVGTPAFFDRVAVACRLARELGLEVGLMFGSSDPVGGPFVREAVSRQLVLGSTEVDGPARFEGALPSPERPLFAQALEPALLAPFDADPVLVSAVAWRDRDGTPEEYVDLRALVSDDRLVWDAPAGRWRLFAIYENRVGHKTKFSAYPGPNDAGRIVDHLDRAGIEEFIRGFGEPMAAALAPYVGDPFSFIKLESPELIYQFPWTPRLSEGFRTAMGYEIEPYLPLLFRRFGEGMYVDPLAAPMFPPGDVGRPVRDDYEEVRSRLFRDEFVGPLVAWANEKGLSVSFQAHGGLEDYIEAYQQADIPEAEQLYAGGRVEFMKLAGSAAHVAGKRRVSSESFLVHGDARSLRLDGFYRMAARLVAAGVNRYVHYGYSYRYLLPDGSRWWAMVSPSPALSSLGWTSWTDENHPAWPDMPAFNRYLARMAYALSVGKDRAEIAWLHQDRGVADTLAAGASSTEAEGLRLSEDTLPPALALNAGGYTYDWVNRYDLQKATARGGRVSIGAAQYEGLLLTDLEEASPELMASIEKLVRGGVPVFVIGGLPGRAAGYSDFQRNDEEVARISSSISDRVRSVDSAGRLGAALSEAGVLPAATVAEGDVPFRVVRREVGNGTLLVLVNEGAADLEQDVTMSVEGSQIAVLDPLSGDMEHSTPGRDRAGNLLARVRIPARRCTVLWVR
ncbi:MAG: hypothetical protein HYY13_06715 [Nitrospirae bacterium]|nr:hypothetical protein [Nitrospirota bacterium]